MKKPLGVLLLILAAALAGCGISGNLRGEPGYARLDSPMADMDRVMAISLGPLPLRLARTLTRNSDPDAAAVLEGLKAVRVYIYETGEGFDRVGLNRVARQLVNQGWEPVVAVREDGDQAHVLVRTRGADRIEGMVVIAADGDELVMVNLIGLINPAMFNHYMDELEIPAPAVEVL